MFSHLKLRVAPLAFKSSKAIVKLSMVSCKDVTFALTVRATDSGSHFLGRPLLLVFV